MAQNETVRKPLILTNSNFKAEVLESDLPVLVDFWASWCPPCKMLEPVIRDLAQELKDSVNIAQINIDRHPAIAAKYNITGVPTIIIFNKGAEACRCAGAQSKRQLLGMIKNAKERVTA
jgi:thioredoxin 1